MKTTKALLLVVTLASGLLASGFSESFLTNGLVAYYPFNGNANDASGNGNNATPYGTFIFQTNSNPFLNCIHLVGDHSPTYLSGGYVRFPDLTGKITNTITVSLWVRLLDK